MKIVVIAILALLAIAGAVPVLDTIEHSNLPGLNSTQTTNARGIIKGVQKEKAGTQGCRVAITWALTWTDLLNYANHNVPKSLKYRHDAISSGGSGDRLGVFQLQARYHPNVAELMNPADEAGVFISKMKKIKGWRTEGVAALCEKMMIGGFYPFNRHVTAAEKICKAGGV